MALVRCTVHDIPYDDRNPRGCPACAEEKKGGGRASLMQELARASQAKQRVSGTFSAPPTSTRSSRASAAPAIEPAESITGKRVALWQQSALKIGVPLIFVLVVAVLVLRSGSRFVGQLHPVPVSAADARPLVVNPNVPIRFVFSMLGQRLPSTHPEFRSLERYSYGSDLAIDALNGVVYAITLGIPNRSWNGLRVGMHQQQAEGALALLAPPQEAGPAFIPRPDTIRSYVVYRSLEGRPTQVLRGEVRPPNGCYDVNLRLQPRAIGFVLDGDRRYAAIAEVGDAPTWVLTRIEVFSRAMRGPYTGAAAC